MHTHTPTHTTRSHHKHKTTRQNSFVSNLAPNVSDADVLELFSAVGPIRDAGVHYDQR